MIKKSNIVGGNRMLHHPSYTLESPLTERQVLLKGSPLTIGILAIQGCIRKHEEWCARLGVRAHRVLYPTDLESIDGLILPGGESTTMLKNISADLWESLLKFAQTKPMWGICAGCILMAREVLHPSQPSLGVIDIVVERNAYGSQNESFVALLKIHANTQPPIEFEGVFIRAPKILQVGSNCQILSEYASHPVMVVNERHMVTTFHPELTSNGTIHQFFFRRCSQMQN